MTTTGASNGFCPLPGKPHRVPGLAGDDGWDTTSTETPEAAVFGALADALEPGGVFVCTDLVTEQVASAHEALPHLRHVLLVARKPP